MLFAVYVLCFSSLLFFFFRSICFIFFVRCQSGSPGWSRNSFCCRSVPGFSQIGHSELPDLPACRNPICLQSVISSNWRFSSQLFSHHDSGTVVCLIYHHTISETISEITIYLLLGFHLRKRNSRSSTYLKLLSCDCH